MVVELKFLFLFSSTWRERAGRGQDEGQGTTVHVVEFLNCWHDSGEEGCVDSPVHNILLLLHVKSLHFIAQSVP